MNDSQDPKKSNQEDENERFNRESGPLLGVSSSQMRADQTLRIDGDELQRYHDESRRQGSLLVIAGDPADVGTHVLVDRTICVGRDPQLDNSNTESAKEHGSLQLRDARTSRNHFSVIPRNERYYLSDLGSTNGTRLERERIEGEVLLADGDQITIGQTLIKFTLVDDTEAAYLLRMERLAGTDELTGLLAKHRFDSLLADSVRNAHAQPTALSVLMMDLDGLKSLNDRHGHHMGAHTIGEVGKIIGDIVSGRGEACRFGGDEFCAFFPGLVLDRAMRIAERIRRRVEESTFVHNDCMVKLTISIGVAILKDGITNGEALLEKADQALYRAKAAGRNRIES